MATTEPTRGRRGGSLGSLATSLVVHAAILGLLALITLSVVTRRDVEATIALGPIASEGDDAPAAGRAGQERELRSNEESLQAIAAVASIAPPSSQARKSMPIPTPSVPAMQAEGFAAADPAMSMMSAIAGGAPEAGRAAAAGAGVLDGTSDRFQRMVRGLRARGLDVVFVIDATHSMQPYINQAKERLRDIVAVVRGVVDVDESGRNVGRTRFGVVAFKDYGDEYGLAAAKPLPLTDDIDEVQKFIDTIHAGGGGDEPEPIHKALAMAVDRAKMKWRSGRHCIIILVGDAPVHASGRKAASEEAATFVRTLRGQISTIDVGGDRRAVLPDFASIAEAGKGSAFQLRDEKRFWKHLIVTIFGEEYATDVDHLVDRFTKHD